MKLIVFLNFISTLLLLSLNLVYAWFDFDDLLILDLIEEVNQNFYDLLEINEVGLSFWLFFVFFDLFINLCS